MKEVSTKMVDSDDELDLETLFKLFDDNELIGGGSRIGAPESDELKNQEIEPTLTSSRSTSEKERLNDSLGSRVFPMTNIWFCSAEIGIIPPPLYAFLDEWANFESRVKLMSDHQLIALVREMGNADDLFIFVRDGGDSKKSLFPELVLNELENRGISNGDAVSLYESQLLPTTLAFLESQGISSIQKLLSLGWHGLVELGCRPRQLRDVESLLNSMDIDTGKYFFPLFLLDAEGEFTDTDISNTSLSRKTKKMCHALGFRKISELVEFGFARLVKTPSVNRDIAEELYHSLKSYPGIRLLNCSAERSFNKETYFEFGSWLNEDFFCVPIAPSIRADDLSKLYILSTLSRHPFGSSRDEILSSSLGTRLQSVFPDLSGELELLIRDGEVIERNGLYCAALPQYVDLCAAIVPSERDRILVEGRISGKTLEELAEEVGLTREGVRQILKRGLDRELARSCREGRLLGLLDEYFFDAGIWKSCFDATDEEITFARSFGLPRVGKMPLEKCVQDDSIPIQYRNRVAEYITRSTPDDAVEIDGSLVEKDRPSLVRAVLRKVASKRAIAESDFIRQYNEILFDLGLADDSSLAIDEVFCRGVLRSYSEVIGASRRGLRYWDFDEHNVAALVSELDWNSHKDEEISTRVFLVDQSPLLSRYGLSDPYELHGVLRKYALVHDFNRGPLPYSISQKAPMLKVGNPPSREEQVKTFARNLAPISTVELARQYEKKYGVRSASFLAGYASYLEDYTINGTICPSSPCKLPDHELNQWKAQLNSDWYSLQELKFLFEKNGKDPSSITSVLMDELGFYLYSDCAVRKSAISSGYRGGQGEYYGTFMNFPLIKKESIPKEVLNSRSFAQYLWHENRHGRLFDYDDVYWIKPSGIHEMGISDSELKSFYEDVKTFFSNEDIPYATAPLLKKVLPDSPLIRYSFDDAFYDSVLTSQFAAGSYGLIGGRRLFNCRESDYDFNDFIKCLIVKNAPIDFIDFNHLLREEYGIEIPDAKLLERIKNIEVYFRNETGIMYEDYDSFIERIR